jgi:hypothetical protein
MEINPNYKVIDFNNNIQYINELSVCSSNTTPYYTKGEYISQYKNLKNENTNYKKDIDYSTYLIDVINDIQIKKNSLKQPYNEENEKRQLQINNFYILKYKKESDILKQLIFFCGLALLGCIVFMKGFISEPFYIIYLAIIFVIGLLKILFSIYNLYARDNIIFDETDYSYSSIAGRDLYNISDTSIKIDKDKDKDKDKDTSKCI